MYRAKTTKKENGEFNETWVEGDLIHSGGKLYIHPVANKVNVDGEIGRIIVMHEVQPETVHILNDNRCTPAENLLQTMCFTDGYQITQASNFHVTVTKNGRCVFHAQQDHELSGEELLNMLKFIQEIREIKVSF